MDGLVDFFMQREPLNSYTIKIVALSLKASTLRSKLHSHNRLVQDAVTDEVPTSFEESSITI